MRRIYFMVFNQSQRFVSSTNSRWLPPCFINKRDFWKISFVKRQRIIERKVDIFAGVKKIYKNYKEQTMRIWKNFVGRRAFHTSGAQSRESANNLKGRKPSSQQWLVRQLRDPYVEKAKQENYRCRSAFKLLEINERFDIIKPGMRIVDCGAAPGSWTQVAVKLSNSNGKNIDEKKKGTVVAIDRLPIHPINGAVVLGNLDFTSEIAQKRLLESLDGKLVDLVLSDMAPNATGVRSMDHENIINLAYAAMKFALTISRINGTFVVKLWDGGLSNNFEKDIERFYKTVKIVRPDATRDESSEKFILARGFKGLKT